MKRFVVMSGLLVAVSLQLACATSPEPGDDGQGAAHSGGDEVDTSPSTTGDDTTDSTAGGGANPHIISTNRYDDPNDPMAGFYQNCRCECACQGTPAEPDQCPRDLPRCGCPTAPCPPGIP